MNNYTFIMLKSNELSMIYKRFPSELDCINFLEQLIWNGVPRCPYCKSTKHSSFKVSKRYHCNSCNSSYSVTVRTIFHRSHIDYRKWISAISIFIHYPFELTVRELAGLVDVNKNTAWHMLRRIKNSLLDDHLFIKNIDGALLIKQPRRNYGKRRS